VNFIHIKKTENEEELKKELEAKIHDKVQCIQCKAGYELSKDGKNVCIIENCLKMTVDNKFCEMCKPSMNLMLNSHKTRCVKKDNYVDCL